MKRHYEVRLWKGRQVLLRTTRRRFAITICRVIPRSYWVTITESGFILGHMTPARGGRA